MIVKRNMTGTAPALFSLLEDKDLKKWLEEMIKDKNAKRKL